MEHVDSVPEEIAITFVRLTYCGEFVFEPVQPLEEITDEHSPFPS